MPSLSRRVDEHRTNHIIRNFRQLRRGVFGYVSWRSRETMIGDTAALNMSFSATKNTVLAALVATFPCVGFLVFCNGILPVGAMAVLVVRFLSLRDPGALIFVIPLALESALYLFLLNKLAHRLTRVIQRDPKRAMIFMCVFLAACATWSVVPINTFDCMDGHAGTRCSALRMYFGWLRETKPGTSLYSEAKCGDFGW